MFSCTLDDHKSSLTITDIPEIYNGGYFEIDWGFSVNKFGNSDIYIMSNKGKVTNCKAVVRIFDVDTGKDIDFSKTFYISSSYIYKGDIGEERSWEEAKLINGIGTISWNDGSEIFISY